MSHRYSVGSFSTLSYSSDGHSVDSSFISTASTSSSGSAGYEIESDVGREALKEICCSALSRVLDFPDNQLDVLLGFSEDNVVGDSGGGNVAKNLSSSWRNMRKGLCSLYQQHSHVYQINHSPTHQETQVAPSLKFGSPLCKVDHVVLLQLISHLSMFTSTEGLFRKSGNKNRMEQLVKELQEGKLSEVVLNKSYNAHDFASVLKQYFSELPEPLLLKRHLYAYLQTVGLSTAGSVVHCLQLLMLLLPPAHRLVMQHLLDLLCQVTKCSRSKMDARNLSLIFAPTLFLASSSESILPEDYEKFSKLLNYMIENADDIFEVPSEVQVVADRYLKKLTKKRERMSASMSSRDSMEGIIAKGSSSDDQGAEDDDLVIDQYSTSCKRQCVEDFHENGKEQATDELAKLYEFVKNMPEGPQKNHFLKKFDSANKAGGLTPTSVVKKESSLSRLKRSLKRNKENATPKISRDHIQLMTPCFTKGSLMMEFDKADDGCARFENYSTPSGNQDSDGFRTPGTLRAVPMRTVPTKGNHDLPPLFSPSTTMLQKNTGKMPKSIATRSMYVTDV